MPMLRSILAIFSVMRMLEFDERALNCGSSVLVCVGGWSGAAAVLGRRMGSVRVWCKVARSNFRGLARTRVGAWEVT